MLAIIGDNGAGKSTLIKCLTGAWPDAGRNGAGRQPATGFAVPTEAGGG
ncbi:MAG: ATP-binding cassette domain-containing protein [Nocardioides sp.]